MGLVVEFGELFCRDIDSCSEVGEGMDFDAADDESAVVVFLEESNRMIAVGIEGEIPQRADCQKRKHVAAGEGRDECLLGVRELGLAEEFFRRGEREALSMAKIDPVFSRVILVAEGRIVT